MRISNAELFNHPKSKRSRWVDQCCMNVASQGAIRSMLHGIRTWNCRDKSSSRRNRNGSNEKLIPITMNMHLQAPPPSYPLLHLLWLPTMRRRKRPLFLLLACMPISTLDMNARFTPNRCSVPGGNAWSRRPARCVLEAMLLESSDSLTVEAECLVRKVSASQSRKKKQMRYVERERIEQVTLENGSYFQSFRQQSIIS